MKEKIPLSEMALLTMEQASVYFNLGVPKIRELTSSEECPWVVWNGSKRLIKRQLLEDFLLDSYSI